MSSHILEALNLVWAQCGRVCVGLVLCSAALQKLRHRRELQGVVDNYRLLPRSLAPFVATVLPWLELAIGLPLLFGVGQYASRAAQAILIIFAAAMAINLRRGRREIDCGCHFTHLRQQLTWPLVGRNGVLLLLLCPSIEGTRDGVDAVILPGIAAGIGAFLFYLLFNSMSALPSRPTAGDPLLE